MRKGLQAIRKFLQDEQGLTVVEYVVGAALLVTGLSLIFNNLGNSLDAKLSNTIS
jgi:pilus assembly protein Flp/PilA